MSETAKRRVLDACSWCGVLALVVTCSGWLIAGLLPLPLGPSDSTAEVVSYYSDHTTRLMAGQVIASLGVCLVLPLAAVVAVHMYRMEGRLPILTFVQLAAGATTMVINLIPQLMMAWLGYRPEIRDPGSTQSLNDLAWFLLFTPIAPFMIQNVAIGVAVLTDSRQLFPRWVGYLNFWVAIAFIPDVLAYFFFRGAFAWNGIFVFWLALIAYGIFLVTMTVVTRRANAGAAAEAA